MEGRLLGESGQRPVVVRPSDLQRLTLEDDAVEGHGLRGLVHRAELRDKEQLQTPAGGGGGGGAGTNLQEGEVLVLVDLHRQDRVAQGLGESGQAHLRVEELRHGLLQTHSRLSRPAHAGRGRASLTSVSPKGMFPT